jgi:hypothetical protein
MDNSIAMYQDVHMVEMTRTSECRNEAHHGDNQVMSAWISFDSYIIYVHFLELRLLSQLPNT